MNTYKLKKIVKVFFICITLILLNILLYEHDFKLKGELKQANPVSVVEYGQQMLYQLDDILLIRVYTQSRLKPAQRKYLNELKSLLHLLKIYSHKVKIEFYDHYASNGQSNIEVFYEDRQEKINSYFDEPYLGFELIKKINQLLYPNSKQLNLILDNNILTENHLFYDRLSELYQVKNIAMHFVKDKYLYIGKDLSFLDLEKMIKVVQNGGKGLIIMPNNQVGKTLNNIEAFNGDRIIIEKERPLKAKYAGNIGVIVDEFILDNKKIHGINILLLNKKVELNDQVLQVSHESLAVIIEEIDTLMTDKALMRIKNKSLQLKPKHLVDKNKIKKLKILAYILIPSFVALVFLLSRKYRHELRKR
eukprot:COSAG01_NODE_398_length_17547_cov_206.793501_5_plen_362_part_00